MIATEPPEWSRRGVAGRLAVSALLVLVAATQAPANTAINGDFEDNTATTSEYNLMNANFNAFVANATAFGGAEEIELITSTHYGVAPQSGDWKLGLHQPTGFPTNVVDAFSLDLSASVVSGNTYALQFFAAGHHNVLRPMGPAEIGLSSDPTDFGTVVFSGTPTSRSAWTQFDHTFVAPVNASYLTVRNAAQYDMYVFVDNFSLVPEPATLSLLTLGACLPLLRKRK